MFRTNVFQTFSLSLSETYLPWQATTSVKASSHTSPPSAFPKATATANTRSRLQIIIADWVSWDLFSSEDTNRNFELQATAICKVDWPSRYLGRPSRCTAAVLAGWEGGRRCNKVQKARHLFWDKSTNILGHIPSTPIQSQQLLTIVGKKLSKQQNSKSQQLLRILHVVCSNQKLCTNELAIINQQIPCIAWCSLMWDKRQSYSQSVNVGPIRQFVFYFRSTYFVSSSYPTFKGQ